MRVLVCGAAGHAGRHLVELLRAQGDEVVAAVASEAEGARFAGLSVTAADDGATNNPQITFATAGVGQCWLYIKRVHSIIL